MLDQEGLKKKLGEAIRKAREKKGISQKQFEVMDFGIDRQMLSKIETGKRFPTIYTLYKVAKTLDLRLSDLLKDVDGIDGGG